MCMFIDFSRENPLGTKKHDELNNAISHSVVFHTRAGSPINETAPVEVGFFGVKI